MMLISEVTDLNMLCFFIKRHSNAAKASPNALPDRPSAMAQHSVQPDEVDEWWLSASDPAPVPPLFLQSPTELDKKHNWWPGASKTSNHIDEDFLQNDINNLRPGNNGFDQNNLDFDIFEGDARIKGDKSTTKREDVPKLFLDELLEDEAEKKRRKAAVNIQRWFRGWKTRKQLRGQSAVKQLLSQKKTEKEKQMVSDHANVQMEVNMFNNIAGKFV